MKQRCRLERTLPGADDDHLLSGKTANVETGIAMRELITRQRPEFSGNVLEWSDAGAITILRDRMRLPSSSALTKPPSSASTFATSRGRVREAAAPGTSARIRQTFREEREPEPRFRAQPRNRPACRRFSGSAMFEATRGERSSMPAGILFAQKSIDAPHAHVDAWAFRWTPAAHRSAPTTSTSHSSARTDFLGRVAVTIRVRTHDSSIFSR